MSKIFNNPIMLGFDHLEKIVDHIIKQHKDTFPPYNVEMVNSYQIRISLAVAGFLPENLTVTVEDNQLVIRGINLDEENRVYLHKGIANRNFQKNFVLAEGMEVVDAQQDRGLLNILLERPQKVNKIKQITIKQAGESLINVEDLPKNNNLNHPMVQQLIENNEGAEAVVSAFYLDVKDKKNI